MGHRLAFPLVLAATLGCCVSNSDRQSEPSADVEQRGSPSYGSLTIEGVVRDERGVAQQHVKVCAYPASSESGVHGAPTATAITGDDGRFVLAGLSPGRWRLDSPPAVATDLPRIAELVVEAGAADVALVLSPGLQRR